MSGAAKQGHKMECYHCKGKMSKASAPFSVDRHGYHTDHITWDAIPAWVCTQCGEALFEENEVSHIQKALQQVDLETIALTVA
jgi:YgiT-type zinc finger domain-containing protein